MQPSERIKDLAERVLYRHGREEAKAAVIGEIVSTLDEFDERLSKLEARSRPDLEDMQAFPPPRWVYVQSWTRRGGGNTSSRTDRGGDLYSLPLRSIAPSHLGLIVAEIRRYLPVGAVVSSLEHGHAQNDYLRAVKQVPKDCVQSAILYRLIRDWRWPMFAITGFYPGSIEYDFAMWLGANPQVRISLILLIPAVLYIAWRRA